MRNTSDFYYRITDRFRLVNAFFKFSNTHNDKIWMDDYVQMYEFVVLLPQ